MKHHFKSIIFSKTPLESSFIYKREFKIYPIPFEGFPMHKNANHFPLILESWTTDEKVPNIPDFLVDMETSVSRSVNQLNRIRQVTNLLSSLTNHRFFIYSSKLHWSFPLPDNTDEITENINNLSSKLSFEYYYWPGSKEINTYTFNSDDFPSMKFASHHTYYLHDPFEDPNKEIYFPNTIFKALDSYFSLNKTEKKLVDSVTHLICNGIDIQDNMKSLSFLSFVSSLETLINYEYTDKDKGIEFECGECKRINKSPFTCKKCGNPTWGVAAKFREFLKEFVSSSEDSMKRYRKIYSVRSKIVHNGLLLIGDSEFNMLLSSLNKEWKLQVETLQLCRIALNNWLIISHAKKAENKKG